MRIRGRREVVLSSVLVAGLVGAAGRAAGAEAPHGAETVVRRFALVVGNNAPPRAGMPTLRYADDDAIRWALLFKTLDADVEVLTELDADSARLYGADAPPMRSPTRPELDAAMAHLAARMKRAHDDGARTIFFFVYAGHGDVDNGEGYVALKDGPFRRSDLEKVVLGGSPADTNHVIIDACRSVFLAFGRGAGGSRRPWLQPYFNAGVANRFPNTGFLLANSAGGVSHEWEDFQAGIFSHELRSGLLGSADADGDGRITYREIAGFVRVANQAVRNERYRPEMLAQPPKNGDAVLLSYADIRGARIRFDLGRSDHQILEDDLGIRWADLHPGAGQSVTLLVPRRGKGDEKLFVRTADGNLEYPLGRSRDVALSAVTPVRPEAARRGPLHEAFAVLFSTPFDQSALVASDAAGRTEESSEDFSHGHRGLERASIAFAGTSLAALAASGGLLLSASSIRGSGAQASGMDREVLNARIDTRDRWATGLGITGGIFAVAALTAWLLARRSEDVESSGP